MSAADTLLTLFARRPEPGKGKRRIAAELGDDLAHTINNGMYAAAIADLNRWVGPTAIALTSKQDAAGTTVDPGNGALKQRLHIRQPEGTFGQRFKQVDGELRKSHSGPIVFIGSDAPELTHDFYVAAANLLETHDIVLAPATDGGVTLLGARETWPELEQLPWGTSGLCDALANNAAAAGLSVARMPVTADVDTLDDVLRIRHSLRHDERPNQQLLHQALSDALPDIEVIIPVRNDTADAIELCEVLSHQGVDQLTVVDQLNDADLKQYCDEHDISYRFDPASRGARLDHAARASTAGILWFLHADCRPHSDATAAVRKQMVTSDGGCFRFSFSDGRNTAPRWLERLINWRASHYTPYGDQGIFVSSTEYLASGGFAHEPLFEEVPLIKHLKQAGRFSMIELPISVAVRKWQRDGWLRRTLLNRWLVLRYMAGTPPETLARSYTRQ